MTGHPNEWIGRVFFSFAFVVALLMTISPPRFFSVLGMPEGSMSAKQVVIYRCLGVIMAAGTAEFVIKSFLRS